MAERALLARELSDGRYTVMTSRWGGTNSALAAVCAGTAPTALSGVAWAEHDTFPDFLAVLASLDVLHMTVCYRIVADEVTVFLPLWFGLPLSSLRPVPSVGTLVAVESLADARAFRRWFRSLKGTLADAVTAGQIPWPAVPFVLAASVEALSSRERYLLADSPECL